MPDATNGLFAGPMRALQYVADACLLFACVAFAIVVGGHWQWAPFLANVLVVAACLAANKSVLRVAIAALRPTDDQLRRSVARRRRQNTVIIPACITLALGVGLIAGSIPSYWPTVAIGSLMLLLGVVLPIAWLSRLRQRGDGGSSEEPNPNG